LAYIYHDIKKSTYIVEVNDNELNNKNLVRNDFITCMRYYKHTMNSFCKFLKNINVLFDDFKDNFSIAKFQPIGLFHDHGLLWVHIWYFSK
jgi:hypothetical protein